MPQDAVADGTTVTQDATATDAAQQEEFVLEKWLGTQPEHVRVALEDNVAGLKSALKSERDGNKKMSDQLKALSKTATEGSELKAQLDKLSGELADERIKNQFYLDAATAKVTNVKLAWLAAKSEELIDSRGNVDFKALRESNPELFAAVKAAVPPGNQGNGVGQEGAKQASMNNFIRAGTGRSIR